MSLFLIKPFVKMVLYDYKVVLKLEVVLKCVLMEHGVLFVVTTGTMLMLVLSVYSLDTHLMVWKEFFSIYVLKYTKYTNNMVSK